MGNIICYIIHCGFHIGTILISISDRVTQNSFVWMDPAVHKDMLRFSITVFIFEYRPLNISTFNRWARLQYPQLPEQ